MDQSRAKAPKAVDKPSAIFAAAYLSGLNMLVVNLQPLILGAFADTYGFTDRQLGHIGAIFVGFATICSLTGPLWVRRVDWRTFSRLALVLAILTLTCGAFFRGAETVFALFAVLGIIKAALGIPAFASLGDGSNPDRNYGVSVGFQGFLAAAVTAPSAAYVIPHFGLPGLLLMIATLVSTGLLVSHWLPREGTRKLETGHADLAESGAASAIPAIIALVALAVFTASILGFWYFVERIGADRGVPAGLIGLSLSVMALASILTASLVAWLGGRFSSLAYVVAGSFLLIIGLGLTLFPGNTAYVAGAVAFAMGWGLAQPAFYAVVRKVDPTGRLFVAAPAAGGIAGVAIGMAAGPVIETSGYSGLSLLCAVLAMVAAATAWAAIFVNKRSIFRTVEPVTPSSSTSNGRSMGTELIRN